MRGFGKIDENLGRGRPRDSCTLLCGAIPIPSPPLPRRIADSIRNQQVLRLSSLTTIVYCDWILYTLYQTNQVELSGLRDLI